MINSAILNFLNNEDQDIDMQECFDEIFSGVCNPYISAVFLSLLKTRENSIEDIVAGINSARNAIKKYNLDIDYDFSIENMCLNEASEYLDISFATDIVCASCDVGAVKVLMPDGKNKSLSTLKSFNSEFCDFKADDFEKNKFMYAQISTDNPYLKYTQELSKALPYETILNIINKFLNPYNIKNCTLALCGRENVEKYAQICLNLGYTNSIVFSAGDFPYVSIEGETSISEAWKNKVFSYNVAPQLLGIEPNSLDSIKVENINHGAEIIKAVFGNKLKDSNYDAIVINSALALYITKRTKSLMEGIELARKTIDDKKAYEVLEGLKIKTPLC